MLPCSEKQTTAIVLSGRLRSKRNDLHRHFHVVERIRGAFPCPGNRTGLLLLAGHRNGNVLVAGNLVVGRVETTPACAWDVDLSPGVGGAVLTFRHLNIPAHKSRPESPVPCCFHVARPSRLKVLGTALQAKAEFSGR